MPKLDPADTTSATTAIAPLPATPVPAFGSTPTATASTSFGNTPAFGSTPASNSFGGGSSFGAPSTSSFGSSSGGFGSTPASNSFGGGSSFGAPSTSSFGSSSGGFGSPMGGMGQTGMGGMPGGQAQMLQNTGGAMQEGGSTTIETSKGFGDFINSKWRPMMAVIYMLTCLTDFVVFPVLWSVLQALFHGTVTSQWAPLTLQGAGLYHIAMGAVLGLAAYGRSQEKIAGKA